MQETPPGLPATAGELWAQDVLRELRAGRFAPAAWVPFLRASFERARVQRRQRRRAHREALALAAVGIAAWLAVAFGGRPGLGVAGACWWTLVLLMLDWHLGMLERPDGRPLHGLGTANLLSLARAGLVPLLTVLPPIALSFVLFAAGVSDVLDGWIARRRDTVTRLGLWLDPAVDGFVVGVAAATLAHGNRLSVWVAALVIARSLLPWIVVAAAYFTDARAPSRDAHVSGRAPGVLVITGLMLAARRIPGASSIIVLGSAGGLVAFALTIARTLRLRAQASRV